MLSSLQKLLAADTINLLSTGLERTIDYSTLFLGTKLTASSPFTSISPIYPFTHAKDYAFYSFYFAFM